MTAQFFDDPAWLRVASPLFSDAQRARLRSYGTPQHVLAGEVIFAPGDRNSDLMLVDEGEVEVTRPAIGESPEETIVTHRPGDFVGELRLLTGQAAFLTARMIKSGRLYRIPTEQFRRLMAEDPELSDLLLKAMLARRDMLQQGAASYALEIVGSTMNSDSLGLRTYASRRTRRSHHFSARGASSRTRHAAASSASSAAEPATGWLTGVALNEHGFVRTDVQLTSDELGETWSALGRGPLPFETNVPGVFAVGDVRHGSMKRVAAAVGEGASAVRSVHTAIGVPA